MPFVRIDLQLTETQATEVATLLAQKLSGFEEAFDQMVSNGAEPGKHMSMLYRSKEVQDHVDSGGN